MHKKTAEDYLNTIFGLCIQNGKTRNSDVAKALGISRPSVTNALTKLETDGYISRTEDKQIRLTKKA